MRWEEAGENLTLKARDRKGEGKTRGEGMRAKVKTMTTTRGEIA